MITDKDLKNGIIVRARRPRGNMHRQFSLWKVGNLWMRFHMDFGEISGRKDTTSMLRFLDRYQFDIIGEWHAKFYQEPNNSGIESFNLDGAL